MARDRPDHLPRIPELEGDYELVRELGRGGTAVVYLARERELGRDVAIKLIRPTHLQDEDAVARLVREALTVGRLQHPNIVMLLGTRRLSQGGLALILQFVPGHTLKHRIRRDGPLPFSEAEQVLKELTRALAYAHRRRIVHRDIKPENVYLDEDAGIARLADFGIARAWDSDSGLTLPGTAIGTPTYMSPEQVDGGEIDGRSDLYSLGLVAWEMLTGRQPWAGESLYSVIFKQKNEDLPDVEALRPGTPPHLRNAIARAVRKDPDQRWESADDLLLALDAGGPGRPAAARPPLAPPHTPPHTSRKGTPDFFGWDGSLVDQDTHTLQYRRPGTDGPTEEPPAKPPQTEEEQDRAGSGSAEELAARREREELIRRMVETGQPASDPQPPPEPSAPDSDPGPPAPTRGIVSRRRRRRRIGRTVALVILLMAGGIAAAAYLGPPEGQVRSVLAQILPTEAADPDDRGADEEPYGTWQPSDVDPGPASTATAPATPSEPDVEATTAEADAADPDVDPDEAAALSASATRIGVMQGSEQEGLSGARLAEPVVLRVENDEGEPLEGVPVILGVSAGGGSVSPSRAVTDAEGTISVAWTVGPGGTEQRLSAAVEGNPEAGVSLTARSLLRMPARVSDRTGSGQEGEVGERLPEELRLRVVDAEGIGVAGRWVRFRVTGGGGSVAPDSVLTDVGGIARAGWTLGAAPGSQEVVAEVAGTEGIDAVFQAEAAAARLTVSARVVTGGMHSCRLSTAGSLYCWGDNGRGQLGSGGAARRTGPGEAVAGGPFVDVAVGLSHTCALDPDGRAHCWGANEAGQLGDGSTSARSEPVPVAGDARFVEIGAGASHSCGRTSDGRIFCWGANGEGQLGTGGSGSGTTPAAVSAEVTFRALAAGWRHTCAVDARGTAWCWGTNTAGELGRSALARFPVPARVAGGHTFRTLSAGNAHTCGLTDTGQVFCWGENAHGQLGDGGTRPQRGPTPIDLDETFTSVTAGAVHTCAIASSGGSYCWGRNLYGQVGDGSTTDRTSPVPVEGAHRFSRLHAFGSHTCGQSPAGDLLCWGFNAEGQLGDGTRQNRSAPVVVQAREE